MSGPVLMTAPVLVVTSVAAEADAVRAGLAGFSARSAPATATVHAVGVGPAAAAAGTARLLARAEADGRAYRAVICAGIAGGLPGRAGVGAVVLGTRAVAADLGADSPDGFLSLDELGFGTAALPADPDLLAAARAALPTAIVGDVLSVSTVTGTAARAAALAATHPAAVAEAMEGYGVACAATGAGVRFVELRAISNPVGPRERSGWRVGDALAALSRAVAALAGPRAAPGTG